MKPNRLARVIAGLALLFFVIGPLLSRSVDLLTDWLWFNQEGFRVLYTRALAAQVGLSSTAGMGFMAVLAANLLLARSLARRQAFRVYGEVIEFPILERFTALFRGLLWFGVLVVGYLVGHWAATHWLDYLLAQHPVTMHQVDPLFGLDLSFYLFRLPFLWFLYHLALVTLIFCLLVSVFSYLIEGGLWVTGRGLSTGRHTRMHLTGLAALLFLLFAYRARLAMYELLYSPRGLIYGAGYTDVHATLPVLRLMLVLCLVTALVLLAEARRGRLRRSIISGLALVAVSVVGGGIYPELIQRFVVAPNEIDREQPYIARSIEFTRRAYALDRFEEREFAALENLSLQDLRANDATLRNVRLWDHQPLLTTFSQLQEIRTYYDFARVDNDRYWVNGVYRQVSLSPRELNAASLPSRNWINEHLTYTHGYGLCLGPVNESTSDGLPQLFVRDIPPVSDDAIFRITRPEIYFGELPADYCIVDTRVKEFDYPSGDRNVYCTYAGSGGIPVHSFWRRLLFALKFGELKVLLSSDIQNSSRVMIYRRVLERAQRLTPFLQYDNDPYMVIGADGELYWMLDGYTTSDRYPYSDPVPGVGNYIRNAVKATINAYTGRVHFYVADLTDPLIRSYAEIFPGVFQPLDQMPADLRAHIRYPEGFFSIQAGQYAIFHMTDPRVFYNREDLWRVAQSAARGSSAPMTPYYTIMKLAEVGTTEEFILMVPFTPAKKDNMIAWIAARCDPPNYGRVLVFTFPKQKLVYGPQQIEARIDQDPGISQQLTLWDQRGSRVIRGTLLVIPVLNSVLYVEPIYLAAEAGGSLPQLKRVIISYADNVVMEASLDAALSRIFGGAVESAQVPGVSGTVPAALPATALAQATKALDLRALAREANQHYERAQQLLRQGDWKGYGDEIKRLGEVLKQMAEDQRR